MISGGQGGKSSEKGRGAGEGNAQGQQNEGETGEPRMLGVG